MNNDFKNSIKSEIKEFIYYIYVDIDGLAIKNDFYCPS